MKMKIQNDSRGIGISYYFRLFFFLPLEKAGSVPPYF